ncbi:cupin domain-containing protein [Planctobacterium marinum]
MLDKYWHELYQKSQSVKLPEAAVAPVKINQVLTEDASVDSSQSNWLPSPAKGVKRLMLERDGGEQTTRATSIVAYARNSHFAAHNHPLGEEFLVLSGIFSDEHGDYPVGTYVRNPPGSSHAPKSVDGCMIWVKLQQFQPGDRKNVVQLLSDNIKDHKPLHIGLTGQILFNDYEQVSYVRVSDKTTVTPPETIKGIELLLLDGEANINERKYKTGDWLRIAAGKAAELTIAKGSRLLLKTGHL